MDVTPEQIRDEQIRLVYKQMPLILGGSFVAAIILVVFLWNQVPHLNLAGWSVLFILLTITRGTITRFFWKYDKNTENNNFPWGVILYIGAGLAGCLWSYTAIVFYLPEQPDSILLLTCLFAGLIASSGASSGAYMPAFFYFAVPMSITLSISHFTGGSELFTIMGILTILYIGVCGIFVRTYHNNTSLMIHTQFKNKLLYEEVENEKQIAEQAVIEKNRFLAAASHDLRQPLHALGLFIGALRRETSESQSQLVDNIEESVGALNHLFNGLLDVSRLDAGVVTVFEKHIELNTILQRLHDQYLPMAREKNLNLKIDCTHSVIATDPVLLERILRNLMVNAISYTKHGEISVSCETLENSITINISDTGIGIPDSESEAIFSEYYQLNNPERNRNKGLGLGLAIVRRLCNLMEIPLSVKSAQAQGTTFTLQIKMGDANFIDRIKPVLQLSDKTDFLSSLSTMKSLFYLA